MLKDKYNLFIFDLDGTIIDSQKDILNSVNFVRHLRELPPLTLPVVRSYIGNGANILVQKVFPGSSNEALAEAFLDFKRYYYEHPVENTVLYPCILDLLEKLKEKQKVVLTNKPEKISKKILEALDINKYFSIVWGGDTGPYKKPDPDPIHKILDKLAMRPADAVLIGDGINDIKAAKAAGIKTVALGYGYSDKKEVIDLKPEYFAATPQELLELI